MNTDLREEVRARYAEAARAVTENRSRNEISSCCGNEKTAHFGEALYDAEQREALPDTATLASLGCGNPTAVADLREGEVVLDLGSGGGIDVILSAKRVGPTGIAWGLDMTEEMLALARANAAEAGVANAHFLKGQIEAVPLPADSVDVVVSNCVINLSTDKPAVFGELARVLRAGRPDSESPTSSPRTAFRPPTAQSAARTAAASPARSRRASTSSCWRARASPACRSSSRTRSPRACTARS